MRIFRSLMRNSVSRYFGTILLSCCVIYCSCHGNKFDPYDESNYTEVSRGKYKGSDLYAIIFQNKVDTQYALVKVFIERTYNPDFYIQHFEYRGLLDGPMEFFKSGKSEGKQFYKNGKRHGETMLTRSDGVIAQRNFYDMGKKVGAWEFYDSHGKLFKKKYYQDDKFVKQEIYNRDGKLERTEFEESILY